MEDIRKWIIEVWDTFPKTKTNNTGLCTRLVWASPEMPDAYIGFWCETNFKLLALPFSLKNEPHQDAFAVTDSIQALKITFPNDETIGWQILTLQNPNEESQFLDFCEDALSAISMEKDEQQRLLTLRDVLLKWQPHFN